MYNEYAGSPGFIEQDIANIKAVTISDILRVYDKYIKEKPYLATSFVPKGQVELIAENSVDAGIVEENISDATQVDQSAITEEEEIVKTPTLFDRTVEPAKGPEPEITIPTVWTGEMANGMKI
jgi:zinc protease